MATSTELIDLLNDLAEFLEDRADVRDGSYGEQVPNRAMQLQTRVEAEIERLKQTCTRCGRGFPHSLSECHATNCEGEKR